MNDRTEIEARFLKAAAAFEKCAFISARSLNKKMIERSQKIKLPFQQKSRSPHQASLCACNKAATTFENMRLWFITVAAALLHARNETWCGSRLFC